MLARKQQVSRTAAIDVQTGNSATAIAQDADVEPGSNRVIGEMIRMKSPSTGSISHGPAARSGPTMCSVVPASPGQWSRRLLYRRSCSDPAGRPAASLLA